MSFSLTESSSITLFILEVISGVILVGLPEPFLRLTTRPWFQMLNFLSVLCERAKFLVIVYCIVFSFGEQVKLHLMFLHVAEGTSCVFLLPSTETSFEVSKGFVIEEKVSSFCVFPLYNDEIDKGILGWLRIISV